MNLSTLILVPSISVTVYLLLICIFISLTNIICMYYVSKYLYQCYSDMYDCSSILHNPF